ncbi:anti-sigma factor domain-containing protein [Aeromicrobium sp. Leaf350]|uniref:anti-sigma factor n=1 Tax=Aeromicrobium sp. Leaf350 TaxID=2876565 RepID=UPI001E2C1FF7|nr:anti-sigma factor [Aeromicrobium sp. Leaf350]
MTIDLHSLVGPYALDVLEPDERTEFEAHLDSCPTCREEVDGFIATAVRLGEAVAQDPPDALRARILSAAATTPQERPTVVPMRRKRPLRSRAVGLVAAAAMAVAAVGVTGYVLEHQQLQDYQAQQSDVEAVMTAADAQIADTELSGGGTMRLVHSSKLDAAVVTVSSLPTLSDRVYQLWTMREGVPTSAGLLENSDMTYVSDVDGADQMAVTVEPAGGSAKPTSLPIGTVAL